MSIRNASTIHPTLGFRLTCESGFLAVFDSNDEDGVALETVTEDITGSAKRDHEVVIVRQVFHRFADAGICFEGGDSSPDGFEGALSGT